MRHEGDRIGAAAWGFRELTLPQQLDLVRRLGLVSLELGIANSPADVQTDADVRLLEQVKKEYEAFWDFSGYRGDRQ